jgi:hypothetical protein
VSAACTLNVACPEPVWLKCLWRDSASDTAGRVVRTTTQVSPATWPEPSASEQPSGIILMALGRRCGRAADDHGTNSPEPGQRTAHHLSVMIAPFLDQFIETASRNFGNVEGARPQATFDKPETLFSRHRSGLSPCRSVRTGSS